MEIASKISAKMIEQTVGEVAKQQQIGTGPEEDSPFKQMMDSVGSGEEYAAELGMTGEEVGIPTAEMNAISANGIQVDTANLKVGVDQGRGIDKVVDMLSEVNNGQMQMDNMVNQILYSGKKFSNQELLAIQAHVFHFAQVTELVVKAADQGIGSLKSVLNTNVQ